MEKKKIQLGIFSINYFIQGINQSMFAIVIPIYLLNLLTSIDLGDISALCSFILLPFALKFIYGAISDKYGLPKFGKRRPWIFLSLNFAAILWILFPLVINPENAMLITLIFGLIIVLGMAIADTSIDGLILDNFEGDEIGRAQGLCWGLRSIGIIAGGPIIVVIFVSLSTEDIIESAFIFLGILTFISSLLFLFVKEKKDHKFVNVYKNLKSVFTKRKNWKPFIFAIFFSIAEGVVLLLLSLYILIQAEMIVPSGDLITSQYNESLYLSNAIIGLIIGLGVIVGAISGGRFADLYSRKKSVYISLIISTISFLLCTIPSWTLLMFISFLMGFGVGWRNAVFAAVMGQISKLHDGIESTFFATCNSFTNLGTIIGLQLTRIMFDVIPLEEITHIYMVIFIVMALLIDLSIIPFLLIDKADYEIEKNR